MIRKKKASSPTNSTKNRLKGTPFSTAESLNKAQHDIREETWRKLEKARVKRELTQKQEYQFFAEPFRKGIACKYGTTDDDLVRVSLEEDNSVKISINEEMKSRESSEHLLGVLIESMSSTFLSSYFKAMDIIDEGMDIEAKIAKIKNNLGNLKPLKKKTTKSR